MIRLPHLPTVLATAAVATAVCTPVARLGAQDVAPMFRAVVDAVRIDALAHRDGQPIVGLAAGDFIVRDNGVQQRIDSLATTDSAHVIIGFDVSHSVAGDALEQLRAAVHAVTSQLTDRDRISLYTFGDRLTVLARAAEPGSSLDAALDRMDAGGSTRLHDAILLGSLLSSADRRPAVLLLFTDGEDSASWTVASGALDVVRRTDIVVYPVGAGLRTTLAAPASTPYFRRSTWIAPSRHDAVRLLQQLAVISGGEFLRVGRAADLAATFHGILAQYRQRYLITYSPSGTSAPGWHRLDVRLRTHPGAVVAREGYVGR